MDIEKQCAVLKVAIGSIKDGLLRAQVDLKLAHDESIEVLGKALERITPEPKPVDLHRAERDQLVRADGLRTLRSMFEKLPGCDAIVKHLDTSPAWAVRMSSIGVPALIDAGFTLMRSVKGVGGLAMVSNLGVVQDAGVAMGQQVQGLVQQAGGDISLSGSIAGVASTAGLGLLIAIAIAKPVLPASLNRNRDAWNERLDGWREKLCSSHLGCLAKGLAWAQTKMFNGMTPIAAESSEVLKRIDLSAMQQLSQAEADSLETIHGLLTKRFLMKGMQAAGVAPQLLIEQPDANKLAAILKSGRVPAEWVERYGFNKAMCVVQAPPAPTPIGGRVQAFKDAEERLAAAAQSEAPVSSVPKLRSPGLG